MANDKLPIQELLERRYASRKPVSLRLQAWVDGEERTLSVRDLSQTGFLAEANPPLAINQAVELELPHEGRKKAKVVWAGEALAGCTFVGTISRASYSAALLKSQFLHPKNEKESQAAEAAPAIVEADDLQAGKLPMGTRVAVMVIGGALAWVPVLAIAYLLFG